MKKAICLLFLPLFFAPVLAADAPVFYGDKVVVTAQKRPLLLSRTFENVTVISSREIEASGSLTVSDALKRSSIVYVKNNGGLGGVSTIKLKSASSEQILVLLDGVRLNSSLLGMTDLNDIPASYIDRIEVVAEPISSIYGSDAMGGVINIITKKEEKNPVSVSIAGGSFGELDSRISFSGKMGKATGYASLGYLKTDGFRTNSDYKGQDLLVNINIADALDIKYTTKTSDRGNPGVPTSDTDPTSSSTPNDRQSDLTSTVNITFDPVKKGPFVPKLILSQSESDERVHYEDWFVSGLFYDDRYFSRVTQAELLSVIKTSRHSSVTAGVEMKRNYGESALADTHAIDNAAAYFNADIGEDLPASLGISARYDSNSSFGQTFNPKLSVMANLGAGTVVRTTIGQAFRAPTINELYWNDPSFFTFGNPNLKPETSRAVNIGIEKEIKGFSAKLNYYSTKISDMIRWSQTGLFSWSPVNIDRAKIEGWQLDMEKEITDNTFIFGSYVNELDINDVTSNILTYSPRQRINLGFSIKGGELYYSANYRYVSSVFTDTLNTSALNPYQVVDVGIMEKIWAAEVSLNVSNVFNTTYFESVGTSPVDWKERGYPMPGRTIRLGVRI
ncbi:MAG: TonB-dependent receptor [Candidatus Saganbacteria bacterium]|nr:TonB-dependent receptor [Candidatus Saganbacteria bacterium]